MFPVLPPLTPEEQRRADDWIGGEVVTAPAPDDHLDPLDPCYPLTEEDG